MMAPFSPPNRRYTITLLCVTAVLVVTLVVVISMYSMGRSDATQRTALAIGGLLSFIGVSINQIWQRSAAVSEQVELKNMIADYFQSYPPTVDISAIKALLEEEWNKTHKEMTREVVKETLQELGIITK